MVAEFDHALLKDDTPYPFVVQCEQFKLAHILLNLLEGMDNAEVKYSHRVTGLSVTDDSVAIEVETPGGSELFNGRYLIGADGGRSLVRKEMEIEFEGFTWAERFLVLTTPFDFEAERGMCYRNYIADPEEWCNCFKVAGDGPPVLWRTVYPADPETPEESLLDRYDVQRRTYAKDYVQQQTILNKKRLEAKEPEARKRSLDELRATAADPEKARAFMLKTSMIEAMRAIEV